MRARGMVLALALGVAAMGGTGSAAQGAELAVVKVGTLGLISDAACSKRSAWTRRWI
jgi:hypothetical protein